MKHREAEGYVSVIFSLRGFRLPWLLLVSYKNFILFILKEMGGSVVKEFVYLSRFLYECFCTQGKDTLKYYLVKK